MCGVLLMKRLIVLVVVLLHTALWAQTIEVDKNTHFRDILPSAQIYLDRARSLTPEQLRREDLDFRPVGETLLGFGYSPDFDVWLRFELHNVGDTTLHRILEYDNPLTTDVVFYDPAKNKKVQEGLFHISGDRSSLTPAFSFTLQPGERREFYVKASSYITTLIVKLHLWDKDAFYKAQIKHQLFLALFFGAMLVLALYNLFIFFFTRDRSYLYYVLYIVGVVVHHTLYVGIAGVYLLDQEAMNTAVRYASVFIAVPVFALALFSKSFLQTSQYPRIDRGLNLFLILLPLSLVLFLSTDMFNKYRNVLAILLLVYLIIITTYASMRGNRQAHFILFGWCIILVAGMFMYLSSAGIFNVYIYYPYIVETAFVLEALIFSVALADRINNLQKEKNEANRKLIAQQQNERQRLEIKVDEKTRDLKTALDEKGLLLKELNHRVKNNMQTIVSLIRLQADEIEDERLHDTFLTVQNRIGAMGHLHELLYQQESLSHINAYEYFDILIEEVKESYDSEIEIRYDIQTDLKMEQAIYCGLLLNELITNSFKYAFPGGVGRIDICLKREGKAYKLTVSDNGVGYDKAPSTSSLGLVLVNTLAREQLRRQLRIESEDGVKVEVIWHNDT